MKKDSFVFYRSFWESVKALPLEIQHEILTAIIEFGLDKQEPQLTDPYANALWQLIKPQLDANWRKFENGCKGAIHGVKGGNPNFGKGKTKRVFPITLQGPIIVSNVKLPLLISKKTLIPC